MAISAALSPQLGERAVVSKSSTASVSLLMHRADHSSANIDVLGEVIQDSLPPLTLLFERVFRFRIECDAHGDTIWTCQKIRLLRLGRRRHIQSICRHYLGVRSCKVEAEATVFGFHARSETIRPRASQQ